MSYYITQGNVYYEGERKHESDMEVPKKPDGLFDWIGGKWVEGFVDYKALRKAEIPSAEDGVDAIRKEIAAIRAGQPETPDYKAYREKVEQTKSKYPKPEGKR